MAEVKLTTALLRRAARMARQASETQRQLTKAFMGRYGVTYSEVDCDALIDTLDYGQGVVPTLSDCDRYMENSGVKPLSARKALGGGDEG